MPVQRGPYLAIQTAYPRCTGVCHERGATSNIVLIQLDRSLQIGPIHLEGGKIGDDASPFEGRLDTCLDVADLVGLKLRRALRVIDTKFVRRIGASRCSQVAYRIVPANAKAA